MPVAYDPQEPWKVLTKHGRHSLSEVLLAIDYWVLICIHVLLAISFWHCEAEAAMSKLNKDTPTGTFCNVGFKFRWPRTNATPKPNVQSSQFWAELPTVNTYLTSLVVFAIVFFNNHALGTYRNFQLAMGQASGAMTDGLNHCMVFMQYDRPKCVTFMRYLHAAHHLGYYDFGGKAKNPRMWQLLIDRNLLNREEVGVLLKKAANHSNIVSMWALNIIQHEIDAKRIQPALYAVFAADCIGVRSGVGKLKGLVENPMPFHYFHTLNVLLYCWIISIGLYFAGFQSVHASLGFALIVYIFMNLRLIGIKLVQPLGIDPEDFSVNEALMRPLLVHKDILAESTWTTFLSPGNGGVVVPGSPQPDFCGAFTAPFDKEWKAKFDKDSSAMEMIKIAQGRFGLPGIGPTQRTQFEQVPTITIATGSAPAKGA